MKDPAQGHRPIKEWVVIEPTDAFASDGLIDLPEAYDDDAHGSGGDMIREKNRLCLGIVRAVGPGAKIEDEDGNRWRRQPDVEVGERVMYCRASATLLEGTDPMLVTVREEGIFLSIAGDVRAVYGGIVSVEGG
jgi:co-chaperonin GroES (HSP10)